jgi:hypothetical protein
LVEELEAKNTRRKNLGTNEKARDTKHSLAWREFAHDEERPTIRTKRQPFKSTGLDYLGSVTARANGEKSKVWSCHITCFTTRKVHLEIVQDMTVVSFLNALRRFIARRGCPLKVLSDNYIPVQTCFADNETGVR